jgi:pimeloyl-ACP methyl ester carboxylesterase
MATLNFITSAQGRRLAYYQTLGEGVGTVFLGGFKSDMMGTKALDLEERAKYLGRPFLRFDYSGHGQSSGDFADGAIVDWFKDAYFVIETLTQGPQILVGSSMGGWISLLLARVMPHRLAALVGIAAAPDFTQDGMWDQFSPEIQSQIIKTGSYAHPSDYGAPYIITKRLIEDGRNHLVLRSPLYLPCPSRFFQGTADADVPVAAALRLLDHAEGPDIRLSLVKAADHRFSTPECLALIGQTVFTLA